MNKKKLELPLIEPVLSTYHHQGASAAIAPNPSIRNWYLNEKAVLKCSHCFLTDFSSPEIDVFKSSWYNNPYFTQVWYNMRFARGYINAIIRNMINEGYYVCYNGVDDYYVEGKTWYKKRHFRHDGMIFGYDQEEKTYSIYAYDSNWIYSKFKTPQAAFNKGRTAVIKQDPEYNTGFICGIKPTKEIVEFDPHIAIESIKKHLDSSFEKYPIDSEEDILGTVVHDYIAIYVDKLMSGEISYELMDYRVFRMIWEHKRLMLERLQKIERALEADNEISGKYASVVSLADNMRMLYASHHMKRRDSLLPIIRKKLINVKEAEVNLLSEFVEKFGGL